MKKRKNLNKSLRMKNFKMVLIINKKMIMLKMILFNKKKGKGEWKKKKGKEEQKKKKLKNIMVKIEIILITLNFLKIRQGSQFNVQIMIISSVNVRNT